MPKGKLHRLTTVEICQAYPEQAADALDKQQKLINAANKLILDVAFRIQTKEIKMGCLHGLEHDVLTWAAKHPKAKTGFVKFKGNKIDKSGANDL